MRLTCFRLWPVSAWVAFAAIATGWVLWASRSAAAVPGPLGEWHRSGGVVVVGAAGAATAERHDPGEKPQKESWERQLDRVERKRLMTIVVFLGVVLLLLLFWWSWGKLHHRARKL